MAYLQLASSAEVTGSTRRDPFLAEIRSVEHLPGAVCRLDLCQHSDEDGGQRQSLAKSVVQLESAEVVERLQSGYGLRSVSDLLPSAK